jgi:acyl-CoA thioester hydrolase
VIDEAVSHGEFSAPLVSPTMHVEPTWIDYNGHLNMAYYNVLFDRAVDQAYELIGIGADYVRSHRRSCFTAEAHVRYIRELKAGDPVRVTFQLLAFDDKRLHFFERLYHAEENWLSATSENLALHIDMEARRTTPFAADLATRLANVMSAHAELPRPDAAGRGITMPRTAAKADLR